MFLFPSHQEGFEYFLKKDRTHSQDVERVSMFYIFAGNHELMDKVEVFYDFDNQMIRTDSLEDAKISSSGIDLVKLAFNLYNNFPSGTIVDVFANLDEQNRRLALKAI